MVNSLLPQVASFEKNRKQEGIIIIIIIITKFLSFAISMPSHQFRLLTLANQEKEKESDHVDEPAELADTVSEMNSNRLESEAKLVSTCCCCCWSSSLHCFFS